mmetsp:Transcript_42125/g.111001  ORF Transcript_42125/g.111001 Transcript_42125/m.111001 type:complete len:214 (-) Transcript_42125:243-884(-)
MACARKSLWSRYRSVNRSTRNCKGSMRGMTEKSWGLQSHGIKAICCAFRIAFTNCSCFLLDNIVVRRGRMYPFSATICRKMSTSVHRIRSSRRIRSCKGVRSQNASFILCGLGCTGVCGPPPNCFGSFSRDRLKSYVKGSDKLGIRLSDRLIEMRRRFASAAEAILEYSSNSAITDSWVSDREWNGFQYGSMPASSSPLDFCVGDIGSDLSTR